MKVLRAVYLEIAVGDGANPPADYILSKKLDEAMETLRPYAQARSPWLTAGLEY